MRPSTSAAQGVDSVARIDTAAVPDSTTASLRQTLDSLYRERDTLGVEQTLRSIDSTIISLRDSITVLEQSRVPAPILEALTSPETVPEPTPARIPEQLGFIGLIFALFLVPKLLQRFKLPGAITALLLGIVASLLGWFHHDPTINLLSTLGIVALFLFAGLEIDATELKHNRRPPALPALIWTVTAILAAVAAAMLLGVEPRVAALIALAVVTPSTGFILSSLASFGMNKSEQNTVRTYAIGSELIALAALFVILQSTSARQLVISILAMAGVIVVIPLAFRAFASVVAPHAPKSEFAFLVMVAVVCAYATRMLGVYYLVGAFLVGVAAQRYRASHPAMSSEKMIDALESFGSVFIPFYFFHAGTEVMRGHLSLKSLAIGLGLVAVLVPLRIGVIGLHRRYVLGEPFVMSRRIGAAMVPTLVFTLVIVGILQRRFGLDEAIAGGLVLYTILNTVIPGFILGAQPADFEDVEALPLDMPPDTRA